MAAKAQIPPQNPISGLFANPVTAAVLAIAYVVVTGFMLISLDSSALWFPLLNMCVFPLFILSPLVILAAPLSASVKTTMLLVLIIVVMPLIGLLNTTYLELAIQIAIFAGLALGLNIVVGFAGLLDLGYVAFFAVGAYLWAMFTSPADTIFTLNGWNVPSWAFYIFLFLAVGAAGLVGILLGLPVLRLRGDYLAIVTLGFGEMIRVLVRNLDAPVNFTNGSQGLHNIGRPETPDILAQITRGAASGFDLRIDNPDFVARQILFYFLAMAILGVIILLARRLENSAIGRAWTAIREDEVAAIAMGVPLVRMKLLAFATGASFAGAIGVLYAAKQTFIDPSSFVLLQSIQILAMVIVGGIGGIRGVVLGAMIVTLLDLHVLSNFSQQLNALRNVDYIVPLINFNVRDWPVQLEPAKYQPLVFGFILVVMMLFRPAGLLPESRRRLELQESRADEEIALEEPLITVETPAIDKEDRNGTA
ncbi:MAG: branched-chain amino acid ABC transporter permease [bacterium]|nr:branched-chain amino acid ABC transporter permease [bacterium]